MAKCCHKSPEMNSFEMVTKTVEGAGTKIGEINPVYETNPHSSRTTMGIIEPHPNTLSSFFISGDEFSTHNAVYAGLFLNDFCS